MRQFRKDKENDKINAWTIYYFMRQDTTNFIEEKFNEYRKDIIVNQYTNYIIGKLDFAGTEKEKEMIALSDIPKEYF